MSNVVEETVEEQSAETIQLKATFQSSYDTYDYQVSDLKSSVKDTPAFVKITKVPSNGSIVVQKQGEWVVLQEGDMIESAMLKDFVYDQGDSVCSEQDQTRCDDQFSYIPYGEWVGYGDYQKTEIKLTPVLRESSVSSSTSPDSPVTSQLKKNTAVVNSANTGTCQDNTAVMIALCLISVSLLVPIGVLVSKIKNLTGEDN